MNIKTAMLAPHGRLGPATFLKAGLILIAIGFLLQLLSAVSLIFVALGVLAIVMIYPWIVIWVKRLHDAGHSGMWALAVVAGHIVIGLIVTAVVNSMFSTDIALEAAAQTGDFSAALAAANRAAAIPKAIANAAVAALLVFGGTQFLKSDPRPNHYGPPTAS